MSDHLSNNLKHISTVLEQSLTTLKESIKRCNEFKTNQNYNHDQLIEFEALTSRFARVSDIVTQKLLKNIFIVLREEAFTFIDRCQLAEKLNIITSSDDLKQIRDLRNAIAHEYVIDDLTELFAHTLKLSPLLIENIEKINNYIITKKLI